ncbi:MAG: response regulator [Lachnospiraceae bacterium]|nr:response regulator [Lachnospiraceae bacterium]
MEKKNDASAYCYRVKGLYVPYITPADIDSNINDYINKIGQYTAVLEEQFNKEDKNGFISTLESILQMLKGIYAKQCASYAIALIDGAKNREMRRLQQLLSQAIADFLLLSIDMQKAQNINISRAKKYRNVERNEDIAHGLSSLGRLLLVRDYKDALNMAEDLCELGDVFKKAVEMIKAGEYDRVKEMVETIEKENIKLIKQEGVSKTTKTVLAVDDRPEILTSVSAALKSHYKVLGAPGGQMALKVMASQNIDLFYLDIEMPEMDGFELLTQIRANPKYAKTPAIFLTSIALREYIDRGIRLGIDDYIVKPSNHVNLLVKARTYMDD